MSANVKTRKKVGLLPVVKFDLSREKQKSRKLLLSVGACQHEDFSDELSRDINKYDFLMLY